MNLPLSPLPSSKMEIRFVLFFYLPNFAISSLLLHHPTHVSISKRAVCCVGY
jgi:hypothetical protein